MKILLTVHQFFPRHYHGTERHTLELAKGLQALGHKTVVLTRTDHVEDLDGQDWTEYVYEGVRVLSIDMVTHADGSFEGSYERNDLESIYGEILCRERPDIVHCCHLSKLGANFISVAARTKVPVIVSFTDFFGICWTNRLQRPQGGSCKGPDPRGTNCLQDVLWSLPPPFKNPLRNRLYFGLVRSRIGVRLIEWAAGRGLIKSDMILSSMRGIQKRSGCLNSHFHRATAFLTATSYLRDSYIRAGYSADKILTIPFGISQPDARDLLRLRDRYVTLASTDRPMVLGFIGQIAKHKGLLDVFGAFRQGNFNNVELHVYGDMSQDPEFAAVVKQTIADDPRIKLRGTFGGHEIYQRLAEIDVLIVASTWAENSPLVLLNGLASRTMLVVTKVEGMCDLIEDGVNGVLVAPCDPTDMARRFRAIVENRCGLLGWYDGSFRSYSVSPLDYAVKIESLYSEKLSEARQPPRFRSEDFPSRAVRKVALECKRLDRPTAESEMQLLSALPWRLVPHKISIESQGRLTTMRMESAGAHLILERGSDVASPEGVSFYVRWPRPGVSVVYYATKADPEFSERQKIVQVVAADVWCRLSLRLPAGGRDVTGIRWDPLHDAAGQCIEIGAACSGSTVA